MTDKKYLFEQMLRIRRVEEAIADRYGEQQMRCPTHLSIGQEAVAVGVSSALRQSDRVYSSHRAHAHYLAKGGSLPKLIAELYGKATGCTGGRGGSMHLCDLNAGFVASTAIVANSIPVAVGNALHLKTVKSDAISVAYFGEGATEEGAFYESVNFAAVRKLPVLFVCENNRYSVYSSLAPRQPEARRITQLAEALNVSTAEMDGNDVGGVAQEASRVIEMIRQGTGPALIECHTYRQREHCGPHFDDDLHYRPEEEVAHWLARDPITLLHDTLSIEPDWGAQREAMERALQQEIEKAFEFAQDSPFPDSTTLEQHIYA